MTSRTKRVQVPCTYIKRRWITAGPSCLRYAVVSFISRASVRQQVRSLSTQVNWTSGVYVLVRCSPALSDRLVVRRALKLELEVLYIGLSEKSWHRRVEQFVRGLTGGSLHHAAARELHFQIPAVPHEQLRVILVSFSPAYSLETFLIREHCRQTGRYPLLNHGPGTRSSTEILRKGCQLSWPQLIKYRSLRRSAVTEEEAIAYALSLPAS